MQSGREDEEGEIADKWNNFVEGAKDKIKGFGAAMSNFGEFLATNINMVDCCNNVQIEPSLTISNFHELGQQKNS